MIIYWENKYKKSFGPKLKERLRRIGLKTARKKLASFFVLEEENVQTNDAVTALATLLENKKHLLP